MQNGGLYHCLQLGLFPLSFRGAVGSWCPVGQTVFLAAQALLGPAAEWDPLSEVGPAGGQYQGWCCRSQACSRPRSNARPLRPAVLAGVHPDLDQGH